MERMGTRGPRGLHSLAEDDAILQAQLEVGANAHARHLFNPVAKVFFRLVIILGSNLKRKSSNDLTAGSQPAPVSFILP